MRLRVVTLNVWNDEGDPRRAELINAELRRLEPDVLALQEVLGVDHLATLIEGTGLRGIHQVEAARTQPPAGADRYGGNAVASRWPHRLVEGLDLRGVGIMDVPWHALALLVALPDLGEVLFLTCATTAWLDSEADRERQAMSLSDLDARHRTALPTVIAGDFNATPDSASMRYLTGRQSLGGRSTHYHDAWEVAGAGDGLTWSAENPNATKDIDILIRQPNHGRRIDYILVGSPRAHPDAHARVRSAALAFDKPTDGVWPSDHYGVVADLDIGLRSDFVQPSPE